MSSIVSGVVSNIGTRDVNTRYGTKKVYSFQIGGSEWFKHGFKDPKVVVGDAITFEYEEGTYGKDVVPTSIKKNGAAAIVGAPPGAPAKAAPAPFPSGGKGVFPIPALDGQRAIVRQNALTNAREMVCALIGPSKVVEWSERQRQFDGLAGEIERIARKFEAYSCGDSDMKEVEDELKAAAAPVGASDV